MASILIIEDEVAQSTILCKSFENEGYTVLVATNGKEGLQQALQKHPDMILLDIIMPVMDGLTMLKELRKDAWGATAKVTILSNLSDDDSVNQVLANQSFDFLVKSDWKISDVVAKVNQQLGR